MTVLDEAPPIPYSVEVLGPPEEFTAVRHGPVWETDDDGDFVLPEFTLGWDVIAWCAIYLRGADGEDGWTFTLEQARFILWFYAIDKRGRWLYREAVIQKVKGWGKDPLAAVICAVELVGPCRFGGWRDADGEKLDRYAAEAAPIAIPLKREPWIQIVGTAREQTKNTMAFLQGIFTDKAKKKYDIEVLGEKIWALGHRARLEVITSAPRTMEGNRPSFAVKNEPQHWVTGNDGIAVNKTLDRNITKMRSPRQKYAHTLAITNAPSATEESVGKSIRETYETQLADGVKKILYDSLEAPEEVSLMPKYTRLDEDGNRVIERDEFGVMVPPERETIVDHISRILDVLRGDAIWLDAEETTEEILKPDSDWVEMRRFYLNSTVSGDDMFVADGDLVATRHPVMAAIRDAGERGDVLRTGWQIVGREEPVVMFFDGSKSDDSTAIVGCRLSDDYLFLVGIWEKPPGARGRTWLSPRNEVDGRVHEAFARFNVVAFFADPSHTRDDESSTRYWDGLIDEWHVKYHERLQYHAVQVGDRKSSIMWDMTSPTNQKAFSDAVVRFGDEAELQTIIWDGHPALRSHLRNARRTWGSWGMTIRKPTRGSSKKIDAGVCAVGAKMLSRLMKNKGLEKPPDKHTVWW